MMKICQGFISLLRRIGHLAPPAFCCCLVPRPVDCVQFLPPAEAENTADLQTHLPGVQALNAAGEFQVGQAGDVQGSALISHLEPSGAGRAPADGEA